MDAETKSTAHSEGAAGRPQFETPAVWHNFIGRASLADLSSLQTKEWVPSTSGLVFNRRVRGTLFADANI